MSKKKILIVSRAFYPINSARSLRTTELVKEFARQGHRVTLITVKDNDVHVPFEKEHGVEIKDMGRPPLSGIDLSGGSRASTLFKRVLRRALNQLFEYPDIQLMYFVKKALERESGYDLLISIATPHPVHWGVAWARKHGHRIAETWVADCGDPYYGKENDSFKVLFYFAYLEKWFSRKADYIAIPFEGAKSAYFPEFHSKIRIIPQGFTFPEVNKTRRPGSNGVVTFAYVGNIASYRHYAVPFLNLLNAMDKPFKFIVYTRREDIYKNVLNPQTLARCELRGYVPRERLFHELSAVDFFLHFPYQNGSQRSLKLVDYAHMDKPILSFKDDEHSRRMLNEFMNFNFQGSLVVDNPEQYRIENVTRQFLKLCSVNES